MVTVHGMDATFRFLRPHAQQVHLVGEFNNWQPGSLPMKRSADGFWMATLRLDPGEYRFRYWADEQWFVDYASFGFEHTPFGPNGIVRIPETARAGGAACESCPHLVEAACGDHQGPRFRRPPGPLRWGPGTRTHLWRGGSPEPYVFSVVRRVARPRAFA